MTLPEYIRQIGVAEFAKRFDVSERAAVSWMYRARVPKRAIAQRIVERSDLTWAEIYAEPRNEVA